MATIVSQVAFDFPPAVVDFSEVATVPLSIWHPQPEVESLDLVDVRITHLADLTGLTFSAVDPQSGRFLEGPERELGWSLPNDLLNDIRLAPGIDLREANGLLYYLATTERGEWGGVLPRDPDHPPADLVMAAAAAGWSTETWQQWLNRSGQCNLKLLRRLLNLGWNQLEHSASAVRTEVEAVQLTEHLSDLYEEINLYHKLAAGLKLSADPAELAAQILPELCALTQSECCLLRLVLPDRRPECYQVGNVPFADGNAEPFLQELTRFAEFPSGPHQADLRHGLLIANQQDLGFASAWPGVRNLVAAPVTRGNIPTGWLVVINRQSGQMGTCEGHLVRSLGSVLGSHMQNIALFQEQEALLVSFVRSLVTTIDAKDHYTRGHSERVAEVARRLAKQCGLDETIQESIHLAGLLHDIGKIGVDDAILTKRTPLTPAEFRKVQEHPLIGWQILVGLKQLAHILPGVRSHHENYDGSGYPDKLAGEQIPLMARIMAVADAYDAMASDRPYRAGMPLAQIEDIFLRGSGKQWDAEILRGYFNCRDEIRRSWLAAY